MKAIVSSGRLPEPVQAPMMHDQARAMLDGGADKVPPRPTLHGASNKCWVISRATVLIEPCEAFLVCCGHREDVWRSSEVPLKSQFLKPFVGSLLGASPRVISPAGILVGSGVCQPQRPSAGGGGELR